jgi:hypothetical protein
MFKLLHLARSCTIIKDGWKKESNSEKTEVSGKKGCL